MNWEAGTFANATEMPGHRQLLPEEIIYTGTALGSVPPPCKGIHVAYALLEVIRAHLSTSPVLRPWIFI